MKLRIGLVEDDNLARSAMEIALQASGLNVVFSVGSASEAIAHPGVSTLHVAMLDLHLGKGPTGVDLARELRRLNSGLGIIFLTSFNDPRLLNTSIDLLPARSSYLTKQGVEDLDSLVKAIYSTAIGLPQFSKDVEEFEGSLPVGDRQIEILKLVSQGLSNLAISQKLSVSERTVESAIRRLIKQLDLEGSNLENKRVHLANVFLRARGIASLE